MTHHFFLLLRKDLRLMLAGKFFLLALGSLLFYSLYINLFYAKTDQDIYPVYVYGTHHTLPKNMDAKHFTNSLEELNDKCMDGYSVGIDASGENINIVMKSSGINTIDALRVQYAESFLQYPGRIDEADKSLSNFREPEKIIKNNSLELKNRREITCEFLFFELAAVGFLGLASLMFKEKEMGVIRVYGILPGNVWAFIFSKLTLFVVSDLVFCILLTLINVGWKPGIAVLPAVLVQTGILSMIMSLAGLLCSVCVSDFRQFSLLYLVLAIFVTTPVFLVGQTSVKLDWMLYHPMYHLFMQMKGAYFSSVASGFVYYAVCTAAIIVLLCAVYRAMQREMAKEG